MTENQNVKNEATSSPLGSVQVPQAQLVSWHAGISAAEKIDTDVRWFRSLSPESTYSAYRGVVKYHNTRSNYLSDEVEALAIFNGKPRLGERYRDDRFYSIEIYFTPLQELIA